MSFVEFSINCTEWLFPTSGKVRKEDRPAFNSSGPSSFTFLKWFVVVLTSQFSQGELYIVGKVKTACSLSRSLFVTAISYAVFFKQLRITVISWKYWRKFKWTLYLTCTNHQGIRIFRSRLISLEQNRFLSQKDVPKI